METDAKKFDRMRQLTNEELLKAIKSENSLGSWIICGIKRGGLRSMEMTIELFERKELDLPKEVLIAVLRQVKAAGVRDRNATLLRNEAAKRMKKQGLLDKETMAIILNVINDRKVLEMIIETYAMGNSNIPNSTLNDMLHCHIAFSLKERLAEIELRQNPGTDDLLVIIEELEDLDKFPNGSIWQKRAINRLFQKEVSIEDFKWIVGFIKSAALMAWKKRKEKDVLKKLSLEDIFEIAENTEARQIKTETTNRLWIRRDDLSLEQVIYLEKNADLVTINNPEAVRKWLTERAQYLRRKKLREDEIGLLESELQRTQRDFETTKDKILRLEAEIQAEILYPDFFGNRREVELGVLYENRNALEEKIATLKKQLQKLSQLQELTEETYEKEGSPIALQV